MKPVNRTLILLWFVIPVTLSAAAHTPFKHVIIVVQENRTPDNLFGSDAGASNPQLPGADLAQEANCHGDWTNLTPFVLNACFDPDHGHGWQAPEHDSWVKMYDMGLMDRACDIYLDCTSCSNGQCPSGQILQQTYVDNSDRNVQPYFDIAKNYGYANYMFATNQGPSFEAHQFLFAGTSAPTPSDDTVDQCYDSVDNEYYPCYEWFAAELQKTPDGTFGCLAGADTNIVEISPGPANPGPGGNEYTGIYNGGFPCYEHNTLADLLDQNDISWKYYPQGKDPQFGLWTAPNAIKHICQPADKQCQGPDWVKYVQPEIPPDPPVPGEMAPILSDIQDCNLPAVSWVIPDGSWSDHAGINSDIEGPAWVAAIVNAVGNSWTQSLNGGQCDYWGSTQHQSEPTAILVVWDDWGGWYDHILPWNCQAGPNGRCQGYPNNTGNWYVYGFRVPLLAVSAYNYRPSGSSGYISGALPPYGPGEVVPYVHDFGSILNFTEYVFGLGEVDPYGYHYADYWAPDAYTSGNCGPLVCPYGLSDFFDFNQSPTTFATIPLPPLLQEYTAQWFEDYGTHQGDRAPSDPDDDAIER